MSASTTATGVSGNTRITEEPVLQAVTAIPPSDGTVVPLARLTLDASANEQAEQREHLKAQSEQLVEMQKRLHADREALGEREATLIKAEQAREATPYGMQRLLSQAVWDVDGVRDEMRASLGTWQSLRTGRR